MKRSLRELAPIGAALAACLLAACTAPAARSRTIEPHQPGLGASASDEDVEFTLSRAPQQKGPSGGAEFPIHSSEKWFPFRAQYLNIGVDEARRRDARLSKAAPPKEFWDEQTAIEAVSVWTSLCNECHGGRRRIRDALAMPPPPAGWGQGSGLFFGKRRPYPEIFAIITEGGPMRDGKASEMPSWEGKLSREQIWALIYFLEAQSAGIEGVFPPSLYPRGPHDVN